MKNFHFLLSVLTICFISTAALAANTFNYDEYASSPVPIPHAEKDLQTVRAEALKTVNSANHILEGAIFDKDGNLYFCDVTGKKIYKLGPDNQLTEYVAFEDRNPSGLAFGSDGRLFIAAKNSGGNRGYILAFSEPEKKVDVIVDADKGFLPNDLVFDKKGGIYFSDCKGSNTARAGGIFYLGPDLKTITPVMRDMGQANGVALSPDDKTLWTTEYAREQLLKSELDDSTTLKPFGAHVPYHFTGRGPDSMRVDADGNVYVAMMTQGRVLIFNPNGFPIGQILLPGRENGENLLSTSLAIHPQKKEVRIVSGNSPQSKTADATIFIAPSFAPGLSSE